MMSVAHNSVDEQYNAPPGPNEEEQVIYEVPDVNSASKGIVPIAIPREISRRADVPRPPPARINLSHTIRRLRMCGWYWGDISSNQANFVLKNAQNGSFILRDSTDACHLFTLSLKANNIVMSVRVVFSRGLFKLDSWNHDDSPSFSSVVDMIDYYLEDENHEFYVGLPEVGEFPVCLKHPIWKSVPALQHLCRGTIVKYYRTSKKLRLLPLPPHLIRYVLDFSPEDPNENENGNGTTGNENGSVDTGSEDGEGGVSPGTVRNRFFSSPTT